MSNLKNQTQDLLAIDAVQDLDNESAVAVAGGLADVVLYSRKGEQGSRLLTDGPIGDLRRYNFNNITSSVAVNNNKTWRFYDLPNFRGAYFDVGPDTTRDLPSGFDNRISSLKSIS